MENENINCGEEKRSVKAVIFDMGGVIYPHPKRFVLGEMDTD
jgi:hypothetical protein